MRGIEKTFKYILLDILKIKFIEEKWDIFWQFIKFGMVGVTNTTISYSIYSFTIFILQGNKCFEDYDYVFAQLIAFSLSVLWSFYWNNKLVFVSGVQNKRDVLKTLLKTYISYSFTGLFLNSFLLALWIQVFHVSKFIAPILNLIVSVPTNFLINKFWAFKDKKGCS